ncbi:hypothetical protein [Herbiconiux sp. A18JL235]|uniref:Restriction endonuclease type IV Mrr domain-containing protein n=1 Tax=Herbiconiux sp. A18JL235 TaxID=3152363 RepID=A0AB39BBR8_9MICO
MDEAEFNKLAEALLVAEYTKDGLRAQAIDGRGGDGGVDVDVRVERTQQLTQIFQLKYFPEGFSGGFKQRRSQIKHSFEAAMSEAAPVWTLVFPKNPTVNERKVVQAMGSGQKVRIRIFGAAELDGLASKNPLIAAHAARNEAVEVLREINRPEAALTKAGDLRLEVQRLQNRLDGRSPYWGTAISTHPDGTYVETLYAKRDDAQQREPLSITFTAEFTQDDSELRKQFDDKMKFGGSGALVLPERVIKEFRRDGPEWFEDVSTGGEVEIRDVEEHESQPVKVELYNAHEKRLAQLPGVTKAIDRGYGGASVETALRGGLDMRWRFSDDREEGGSVTLNFEPAGSTPREVRQALRFVNALGPDVQVRLTVAGSPALKVNIADKLAFGPDQQLIELVDDLCVIEDKLDVAFKFPADGADITDRIWARVVVRMLEGKPVPMPFTNSFTGTLSGTKDEGFDLILTQGVAVCVSNADWELEIFGETVHIGEVWIYSHHVTVTNGKEIDQAFAAGTAAGMKVQLQPINGEPFLIYDPQRLSRDPNAVVGAYPWGLTGIPEHPQLDALPNRVRLSEPAEEPATSEMAQRALLRVPLTQREEGNTNH